MYDICRPIYRIYCIRDDSTKKQNNELTRNEQPCGGVREEQRPGAIGALDVVTVRGKVDLRDEALVRRYRAELGEPVPRGVDVNLAIVGGDGEAGSVPRVVHVADPVVGILNNTRSKTLHALDRSSVDSS